MKFGIREVCNCHFEHLNGNRDFDIDTAKMSTLESGSTTVYAPGGRGFARLSAWEGEKTVTFTIEDALLTKKSLSALLGEDFNDGRIRVKTTSFAGYYKITADTLVRNVENGEDEYCKITIYKAKLQSNVNLSMAPSGDPSTFTFTFDAFPVDDDVIYDCAIGAGEGVAPATTAILYLNGVKYTASLAGGNRLYYEEGGSALTLEAYNEVQEEVVDSEIFKNDDGQNLGGSASNGIINGDLYKAYIPDGEEFIIPLAPGSTTYWYAI